MLIVGANNSKLLDHLPETFLLIDDGPLIDRLTFRKRAKVIHFDPAIHSLNPIKDMSYKKARDFISVLDAVFPEGQNTLTKKNSNFELLKALTSKPSSLLNLIPVSDDPALKDARQKIETLLMSPVLNGVLLRPYFPMKGIVIAKLDRAQLGEFDAFVLGNLLAMLYKGHVVISDYGFYACPFHLSLIRQGRLTAQVNFLDELTPAMRNRLLLMPDKIPSQATYDDAEMLALHEGLPRNTNAFADYVAGAMKGD